MYTTNSAEAVYHVLHSSNANIVIVDDTKQMDKIKEIKHRLPNLKAAVQLYGPYEPYVKREDGYYRVSGNVHLIIQHFISIVICNRFFFVQIHSGQRSKKWN